MGTTAEFQGAGIETVQQFDETEGGVCAPGGSKGDLVQLRADCVRCLAYGTCQVGQKFAVVVRLFWRVRKIDVGLISERLTNYKL